jgi:hypothetical protein
MADALTPRGGVRTMDDHFDEPFVLCRRLMLEAA